jgi:D-3-phosphoglycerate dehydrogenase / 2-oxoglutarate reductase
LGKPVVYISDPISQVGLDALAPHCHCVAPWLQGGEAAEIPAEAEGIMVRTYPVNAERIAAAPNLRVIAKHGVGIDNIDVDAATARGIPVLWTPEANADAVAQHTLALILGMANRLREAEEALRAGEFVRRLHLGGVELTNRVLGIVGLGRIGRRVARRAVAGLGMQVLAYDPYVHEGDPATLVADLEELLARADVVTLHVPLTDETRAFINATTLAHMKPDAFLVNTSRGGVIDERALGQVLAEGKLAGAGLDVYADEPPALDHPFLSAPRVLLTPHVAGLSDQALIRVATEASQGIIDVLQGRRPASPVNPEVL